MNTATKHTTNNEATIKLLKVVGKVKSISIFMPIWEKTSEHGNLFINLPLLGLETIAKDNTDSEAAIREIISSFCTVAEKFGQGIEKELQALGWVHVDDETGEPIMGYNVSDADSVIERIMQTGENYINQNLAIA